jgi:prepilin-type N-terminal cleavage/methylation domain-containing protein
MRGLTLPELLIVLVLIGLAASIALRPVGRALDRVAVDEGATRYGAMFETTRSLAIARGRHARIELDTARGAVVLSVHADGAQWDTVDQRPLGRARVETSQTTATFSPLGVGFGLSNARIVFTSGAAAETLTVSRTGRLKRS